MGGAFTVPQGAMTYPPSYATQSDVGVLDSVSELGGPETARNAVNLHDEISQDLQSFGLLKSWKLAMIAAALWGLSAIAYSAKDGGLLLSKELAALLFDLLQMSHVLFDCCLVVGIYALYYYVDTQHRVNRRKID